MDEAFSRLEDIGVEPARWEAFFESSDQFPQVRFDSRRRTITYKETGGHYFRRFGPLILAILRIFFVHKWLILKLFLWAEIF
jgi:hypothetical protein